MNVKFTKKQKLIFLAILLLFLLIYVGLRFRQPAVEPSPMNAVPDPTATGVMPTVTFSPRRATSTPRPGATNTPLPGPTNTPGPGATNTPAPNPTATAKPNPTATMVPEPFLSPNPTATPPSSDPTPTPIPNF